MSEVTSHKTIAKNTLFLYFRMLCTMFISLYTSRVVLQILGIDDYGIYQAVGGIVGFLSFLNSALSGGSSRFLTYELGTGDSEKLKRTFSTTLLIHVFIAFIIVLLAETIGLWFLYHKMIIPADKWDATIYVYHVSILTAFFSIIQVPYNASIIAHEKMGIFAYISVIDVIAKWLVVYLLEISDWDKLKVYATLLFAVQTGIMLFYRFYCTRHFQETRFHFVFDKTIFKSIAGFSGWSLFAGSSIALQNQGILLLLNIFFSPAVVTARTISIQVNMAANQFVTNFRTAVNPQIIKRYAMQDYSGSKALLLNSTKYSYYMMYLISLPICFLAKPLLQLWLKTVPEYTAVFLQIIIIQSLFQVFDTSFYTALYAKGQLKENALISPTLGFLAFPVTYLLFLRGYSPVALSWVYFVVYAIIGLIVKPLLLIRIVDYSWKDIFSVFIPCFKVTAISLPLPLSVFYCQQEVTVFSSLLLCVVTLFSIGVTIWFLGIEKEMRDKMLNVCRNKIKTFFKKE